MIKTRIPKITVILFSLTLFFITSYELRVTSYELFAQEPSKEQEAFFVAQKAFEDGFYEVSLGLFERFLKNYPDSPKGAQAKLFIGRCYFQQNRFLDALSQFEGLLANAQTQGLKDALLYWIAEVHFRGNNFGKAASYYKAIIEEFPASAYCMHAYYSLGWSLFQEHLYQAAMDSFKAVQEKFPKEALAQDAAFKAIECLYNLKDYNILQGKIKSYLERYPKDAARSAYLHFYAAEAHYYLNSFQEAADEYAKVISAASTDDKIGELSKIGQAWAYLKLKRYDEAEESFSLVKTEALQKENADILSYGRAVLYSETKRFAPAQALYDELINGSSDEAILIQAYLGKADDLYDNSDYAGARGVYKQALEKAGVTTPQDIIDKLHYGLAWSSLKEGEFKDAIEEFQKIARGTEDKMVKVAALCHIGDAYQDSGDYAKAAEAYSSLLKDYPDTLYSDYVQCELGKAFLKLGNYDAAIMSLAAVRTNFPESKLLDDASYYLGVCYFQRQDYNSSRGILKRFQDEFKDSSLRPQAMNLLASSLYNLGDFSGAIEIFKDIIRAYNQDPELLQKAEYEIADCYYQMGDEKEAVARFKLLRSKYPDSALSAEVMWWLGAYYYRRNDFTLARRYFSSLIQDFPKSNLVSDAYYALGSIHLEEGDYEEALDNLAKVTQAGKSDLCAQALVSIADIYVRLDKPALAVETYKKVSEDYGNLNSIIYPKLAEFYYNRSDYAAALEYYRKSLDVVPVLEMADIQFKIAQALQEQGQSDSAVEEYLKVTYLYSDNKDLAVKALLRLAKIYEDRDNLKEALNFYSRVAETQAPEAKFARERIDWIKAHVR